MTTPRLQIPEATDPAHVLDAVDTAIDQSRVAEATALLDDLAVVPLEELARIRVRVAEGRLAVLAGRPRAAFAAFEDAIAACADVPTPEAARVSDDARLALIQVALRSGRVQRAATIASTLQATSTHRARLVRSAVAVGQGDLQAIEGIDDLADALLQAEGPATQAFVADTAGLALIWAERYDPADRLLERLGRLARRAGDRGPLPSLLAVQALGDLRSNRYRAAAARADEAIRLADATDRPGLASMPLAVLAVAEAVRGDVDGCKQAAARLAEDAARAGVGGSAPAAEVPTRAALGLLHLGLGEPALTVAQLEPLALHGTIAPWLVMWQLDYAEALARIGRRDDAHACIDQLLTALGPAHRGRARAAAQRVQAMLALADPTAAEQLFAEAAATYRSLGAPFGLARVLLARGIQRQADGRMADGQVDLEQAETLLNAIGAEGWAAQARAAMRPQPDGAAATTWDAPMTPMTPIAPLTPQELQVAALVVTGRSNREVADALFVSARTVESHLGRIYRKLGIRSRSQLIARADEWGLRDTRW